MRGTRRVPLLGTIAIAVSVCMEIVAQPPAPTAEMVLLPEGTPVALKFAQAVTSRSTRVGQVIEFAVSEDVTVDGALLIRKDERAIGYVVTSSAPEVGGKGGALAVEVTKVRANNKTLVSIRGERSSTEKRSVGKTVGLTILFGFSGFLLSSGKQAEVKAGTPILAYVAEDTLVTPYQEIATPLPESQPSEPAGQSGPPGGPPEEPSPPR